MNCVEAKSNPSQFFVTKLKRFEELLISMKYGFFFKSSLSLSTETAISTADLVSYPDFPRPSGGEVRSRVRDYR